MMLSFQLVWDSNVALHLARELLCSEVRLSVGASLVCKRSCWTINMHPSHPVSYFVENILLYSLNNNPAIFHPE